MKQLPKYIEKALKLRTKYATKLREQSSIIDDYADKLGCLYDDSGCFITDIRIYCEEDHAEDEGIDGQHHERIDEAPDRSQGGAPVAGREIPYDLLFKQTPVADDDAHSQQRIAEIAQDHVVLPLAGMGGFFQVSGRLRDVGSW